MRLKTYSEGSERASQIHAAEPNEAEDQSRDVRGREEKTEVMI